MAAPRTIGVLGGMGPEATILFQSRMLGQITARDDADHVPLLIDMNPQVPSRIAHLIEKTGTDPGPVLAQMASRLQAAGAEALVMPCNTAHHYAAAITGAVDIPLIHLVDLACDHAAEVLGPGGRVGLLASPAVFHTGLYDAALGARGLEAVWPDSFGTLLETIRVIKAGGDRDAAIAGLRSVSAEVSARGADLQLIACSEFSIIAECLEGGPPVVDTIDLLAAAATAFSLGRQS